MASQKMSERIVTIVITVLITGILSLVGNVFTNGALITAFKGATKNELDKLEEDLRAEIGNIRGSGGTVSVDEIAAELVRNHSDKLRGKDGEPGATTEQVVAELESSHWNELSGPRQKVWGNAVPTGVVLASTKRCDDLGKDWRVYDEGQGRFLLGVGKGPLADFVGVDATGGAETHQLKASEMPLHSHVYYRNTEDPISTGNPNTGQIWAKDNNSKGIYEGTKIIGRKERAEKGDGFSAAESREKGNDQPHNNMPPYVALYFCQHIGKNEHASR